MLILPKFKRPLRKPANIDSQSNCARLQRGTTPHAPDITYAARISSSEISPHHSRKTNIPIIRYSRVIDLRRSEVAWRSTRPFVRIRKPSLACGHCQYTPADSSRSRERTYDRLWKYTREGETKRPADVFRSVCTTSACVIYKSAAARSTFTTAPRPI